ncbi:MAG: glycosyltransferase family protein [Thermodesulfobacteriota bacterium]
MRIVYGVSGEGSGHAARSREVLRHLRARGHDLWVVSYGRGCRELGGEFRVFETEGLHFATADNRVSKVRTVWENLAQVPEGRRRLQALASEVFEGWRPEAALADFEPMTAHLARRYGLPLITVDNQHLLRYVGHPVPRRLAGEAALARAVVRAIIPRPDAALVTTFYFGRVRNARALLFPPILPRDVREAEPASGDHVLVYLTRGSASALARLAELRRERFVVYGAGRTGEEGNLGFRPPSREGFLSDLVSCKAVVATAGFTLLGEALHLGKPYLALPMKGPFEQELNAFLLDETGLGRNGRRLTPEVLGDFLYRLPEYRERLAAYPRSDNRALLARLEALLSGA